jgi:endonuclease YncB( thermonuclease family)
LEIVILLGGLSIVIVLLGRGAGRRGGHTRCQRHAEAPRRPLGGAAFDPATAIHATPGSFIAGAAYVIDGDTIVIAKTHIRLFGIDAPELHHPFGQKAKWALVGLCRGRRVLAEITDVDAHGRTVAKCTLPDGRDLSAELVERGLALDWPKFSGGAYRRLEPTDARKKLWLADARQKGRQHVWAAYEARRDRLGPP